MAGGTLTRGDRNIRWIESQCVIPEGMDVGKRVVLRPWQKDIIRGIYDQPTRRAIISFGRKNAKTTLSAFLLLLHLCGREVRPNSQLYSTGMSRDQAAVIFNAMVKIVQGSPELDAYVAVGVSSKELRCPEMGTKYKALTRESKTAHGLSPVFVVHDELGQVRGDQFDLYDALETASAAQVDPLSIVISTQAETDQDLLSILIDDAARGGDPKTRLFLYTADVNANPFAVKTIKQANPAYGDFQNADEVKRMAEEARRMPSQESSYRNLVLNQRVRVENTFISQELWNRNKGAPAEDWSGHKVYGGLDLSSTTDLTAFVLVCKIDGVVHVRCRFWLPGDDLDIRGHKDSSPYELWKKEGWLTTTEGKSVGFDDVAADILEQIREFPDMKIGYDRMYVDWLFPNFVHLGVAKSDLEDTFYKHGQSFVSMTPPMREFESLLVDGRIRHGNNPLLTRCALNATVKEDHVGNRMIVKGEKNKRGRIDGIVALLMAIGMMAQDELGDISGSGPVTLRDDYEITMG